MEIEEEKEFDENFGQEVILGQEVGTMIPGLKHFISQLLQQRERKIIRTIEEEYGDDPECEHGMMYYDCPNRRCEVKAVKHILSLLSNNKNI